MLRRLASPTLTKQVLATGLIGYNLYAWNTRPTLQLDGTFDKIKEAASDVKDKVKAAAPTSPLKPQSPSGVAGARTSHNPSTSINHGQTAGESDDAQPDPLVSAQKNRQKASGNATDNDTKEQNAKKGGGTGAKIASGHSLDGDGKRVPNHDGIKSSSQPKKEPSASKSPSPAGEANRAGAVGAAGGLTAAATAGMAEKQEEADQQEAFNEETGEINWDCPCLGGMAHGPCGEDFKAAFSCFVYSKEEPKGSECLDKFKSMQECFKEHPEIYGNLTEDDETPEGKIVS